jgi:Uma2 family endonuclease
MAGGSAFEHPRRPYVGERFPSSFPEEVSVPETGVHLRIRTALFLLLERELRGKAFVGSDQFLYWDPTDSKCCLAPDVMVRLGMPSTPLGSYKTWQHGAPHVAIEIISEYDSREDTWKDKLERYRRAGVAEVVRFDPEAPDSPLALWDIVDGVLVARELAQEGARRSPTLGAFWVVFPDPELGQVLRIARDAAGKDLWLTSEELLSRESAEKEVALARIAELERQLRER